MSIEQRYQLNPNKLQPVYKKARAIYGSFQKIDSSITFNKHDINLKSVLNDIILSYGNELTKKDTAIKMRLGLLNEAIMNNTISRIENKVLLYELCNKLFLSLYSKIDEEDFKFNQIRPYISAKKDVVSSNEMYQAYVIIAASDTLREPRIKFQNNYIPVNQGIGEIKILSSTKGIKIYRGEIEWMKEDNGQLMKIPFEIKYQVK
jgi:hypothetical protein